MECEDEQSVVDGELKVDRATIERAMNKVADQPKELQDWTPDRQCKWFAT